MIYNFFKYKISRNIKKTSYKFSSTWLPQFAKSLDPNPDPYPDPHKTNEECPKKILLLSVAAGRGVTVKPEQRKRKREQKCG